MTDMFSLHGRIALITGGSRGIGRMIAAGFLRQGATVYLVARKAVACIEAAAELSDLGDCRSLPADVSTLEGIRDLAVRFAGLHDTLDILVHNAGASWLAPFESFPEAGWDKTMDINVKSPFFLTQALHAPLARAGRQRCAKVIHVTSIDGLSVNPLELYSYSASKAAVIHLARRLSLTLIKDNIVVNCIAPGAFASDMNREARDDPGQAAKRIPARRIGDETDMAGAAVFLASRAGDYVVGSTLCVDGGWAQARG
jgi:NAD(P)-dependent dehydrogenase (short-subunit alcohol dehydrogenase family)